MLALIAAVMIATAAVEAPANLTVPGDAALTLRAEGRGVQIYVCEARSDAPGGFAWRLKAPRAELVGSAGENLGRHYAGPTWEGADGGKLVGEAMAHAPSPDPSAIDWLLLSAKEVNGVGLIGKARFVRRVRTQGGRAPAAGCSSAKVGVELDVPYTAQYEFYGAK